MPDYVFGLCELLHTTPFAFSSVGQKRDRGPMLDVFPQQKCNRLLDCEQISLIQSSIRLIRNRVQDGWLLAFGKLDLKLFVRVRRRRWFLPAGCARADVGRIGLALVVRRQQT